VSDERLIELLDASTAAFGPSGFEGPARTVVQGYAEQVADEVSVDEAGNLWARLEGAGAPEVVLTAHLDEVGLMVSYVEEDGFLRIAPIGGWDPIVLPAQRLRFAADDGFVVGVVSSLPPHVTKGEAPAPTDLAELAVDIGADDADAVEALGIHIGTPAVPGTSLERLAGDAVAAKALDDRAGCVAVLETLRALAANRPGGKVLAVFTTGEEREGAGAALSARGIDPRLVIVVETTIAADLPGVPSHRHVARLGRGPALTIMDKYWTASPQVVESLRATAARLDLEIQIKQPNIGGTDAATWRRERPELPSAVVATPCRGIHSASGVLRLADLRATITLVEAATREAY
jgi:putative aminopeptidase FrvX